MFAIGRSKRFLVAGSILLIFSILTFSTALAEKSVSSTAQDGALPDAPQPAEITTPSGVNDSQRTGTGSLSGTVLDTNRDVLQGARVTLANASGLATRTVESGNNGQFAFTGLPPGVYKLTVTAPGMTTFTSPQIPLHAGEFRIVPPVTLSLERVTTSVTVHGNKEAVAEEQVHIAVQQRIGGVIPNFYSTYDWNAPPMGAKQKFQLSLRSILDPVSFLSVAGIAGAEQYKDVFPAYGGGIEGYGKRYGAAWANHISGTLLVRRGSCFGRCFSNDRKCSSGSLPTGKTLFDWLRLMEGIEERLPSPSAPVDSLPAFWRSFLREWIPFAMRR